MIAKLFQNSFYFQYLLLIFILMHNKNMLAVLIKI